MGNQNATAITEEEKAADEAPRDSSNENTIEENERKDERESADDFVIGSAEDDHEEDQPLEHIKEQDRHDGVNSVEPISSEIQGIEDQESAIKDYDVDVEDQGTEDTIILESNARVSHESDDLATSDAKAEDHVLEMINQDDSSHVSEVSSQGTEEEIVHLMVAKMSETEEEKVVDEVVILEQESIAFVEVNEDNNTSSNVASLEASNSEDEHTSDQETEVLKAVMDTISLRVESYDHDTEKFYEIGGKSDHDTNNPTSENATDFKDLEIVDAKPDHELASNEARYVIEKSPSFEFTNLIITKTEDSDQTPLLYHKNKAPMRSLSTPVNARFVSQLEGAEERTINMVDYDQKLPIRSPLNDEETHLLKPQKIIQQEVENTRERRNKGRVSGSYFFSSCICCARVEQFADP